jgi:transcriptional regulator with XRE-family HTH domain
VTDTLPKAPDLVAVLVGEHFRKWRKATRRSREQVATLMDYAGFGWSYDVVGRIERGERSLTVAEVVALATLIEEAVLDIIPAVYVPNWR